MRLFFCKSQNIRRQHLILSRKGEELSIRSIGDKYHILVSVTKWKKEAFLSRYPCWYVHVPGHGGGFCLNPKYRGLVVGMESPQRSCWQATPDNSSSWTRLFVNLSTQFTSKYDINLHHNLTIVFEVFLTLTRSHSFNHGLTLVADALGHTQHITYGVFFKITYVLRGRVNHFKEPFSTPTMNDTRGQIFHKNGRILLKLGQLSINHCPSRLGLKPNARLATCSQQFLNFCSIIFHLLMRMLITSYKFSFVTS